MHSLPEQNISKHFPYSKNKIKGGGGGEYLTRNIIIRFINAIISSDHKKVRWLLRGGRICKFDEAFTNATC